MEPKHINSGRLIVGSNWWFKSDIGRKEDLVVYPILNISEGRVAVRLRSGDTHREGINSFLERFVPINEDSKPEVFMAKILILQMKAAGLNNELDELLVETGI